MDKYVSLFIRLNKAKESKLCVADDFYLDVDGRGDVVGRYGKIFDVYHVSNLSINLLFVA